MGRDLARGEAELRRASEINPTLAIPPMYLAVVLVRYPGRSNECANLARRAMQLEPLSPTIHGLAGITLLQLGLTDEAWLSAERALELDPSHVLGLWAAGCVHALHGRDAETVSAFSRAVELSARGPMSLAELGCAHAVFGRRNEALAVVQELESSGADSHYSAHVRWALGDHAGAISLFGQAIRERAGLIWSLHFPGQQGLAEDPRWHEILRSAGLAALIPAGTMAAQ
jgi:Flp pilus assembly protein TadD